MNLKKFKDLSKNKNKRNIAISIFLSIFLIGGIILYRSYALYEEEETFNVLQGVIPEFGEPIIKVLIEGEPTPSIPLKEEGYLFESISCDNGREAEWDEEEWTIKFINKTKRKTTCTIKFKSKPVNFSEFLINKSDTDATIEKIEHSSTTQTPALADYRYIGASPENYVYFGCEENCTKDNLYRIIGVIPTQNSENGEYENRVKLIKASNYIEEASGYLLSGASTIEDYGYNMNNSNNNNWEESTLQNNVLNGIYWNSLGDYQTYIEQAKWYLGALGTSSANTSYSKAEYWYANERSNTQSYSKGSTSYIGNIGLMYASDYGYSIVSQYREESIYKNKESYITNAWLYQLEEKYYEWTMTQSSSATTKKIPYHWAIETSGNVFYYYNPGTAYVFGVRPTFYLKSNVLKTSGNGNINNPYRIKIDA